MLHTLGEHRENAASAGYGRTGGMSSSRCKCSWPRMNTTPPHGDRAGPGAGREARDVLHGRVPDAPPPQSSREGTEFFAMSEDSDVVGGGRPPSLVDVRRQRRVQQRTVEQIVDPVPLVPMLHDVVPQMVEQLVDLLAPLDFRVAEQVIEVPKIVCPPRAARTVLRAPQMAEQLVEVPTVLSYSSLQQLIVKQTVDIPVPGRAGGRGGPWRSSRSPWTGFNSVFWSRSC